MSVYPFVVIETVESKRPEAGQGIHEIHVLCSGDSRGKESALFHRFCCKRSHFRSLLTFSCLERHSSSAELSWYRSPLFSFSHCLSWASGVLLFKEEDIPCRKTLLANVFTRLFFVSGLSFLWQEEKTRRVDTAIISLLFLSSCLQRLLLHTFVSFICESSLSKHKCVFTFPASLPFLVSQIPLIDLWYLRGFSVCLEESSRVFYSSTSPLIFTSWSLSTHVLFYCSSLMKKPCLSRHIHVWSDHRTTISLRQCLCHDQRQLRQKRGSWSSLRRRLSKKLQMMSSRFSGRSSYCSLRMKTLVLEPTSSLLTTVLASSILLVLTSSSSSLPSSSASPRDLSLKANGNTIADITIEQHLLFPSFSSYSFLLFSLWWRCRCLVLWSPLLMQFLLFSFLTLVSSHSFVVTMHPQSEHLSLTA